MVSPMTSFKDLFVKLTTDTSAFDLDCDSVRVQLDTTPLPIYKNPHVYVADEIHVFEKWQMELAAKVAQAYSVPMITTVAPSYGQAQAVYDAAKAYVREGTITMELNMASTDPFDPFKVEAGCAHPDDYREPLPYHGAAPSADEWMCSACGYWKMGKAFGVTPLPQPEPLTDKELDELLEKQAKRSVSDFRGSYMNEWYATAGMDLSVGESVAASFPIPYPRLPMVNAQSSYNSVKALMHELEDRNRQKASILYSPDITVNAAGSMITELRLMMQYNDVSTPIKSVIDGLYTLESVSKMFVRSRDQHYEAHPKTIHDLAREFLTPAGPLVSPTPTLNGMPLQWKLLGHALRAERMFNPGMIAMALT